MERRRLQPFIKWPGGKRWTASHIAERIRPHLSGTYFEPFLGSAAVFFHLRPSKAVLADINEDLIRTYRAVRRNSSKVLEALRQFRVTKSAYYRIRANEPVDAIDRAARFLYLNRTAFGGIYRVNLQGEFNVPYGGGERTPQILWKSGMLSLASGALRQATLKACDFEPIMASAGIGDVIYCDPTYTVAHDNNGFIRYNERNFSWSDQERLAKAAFNAASRGAYVLVSNAHHSSVKRLYLGATFQTLSRVSTVTPHAEHRREVDELLISLPPRCRAL
jgi:DNA adenine methylase